MISPPPKAAHHHRMLDPHRGMAPTGHGPVSLIYFQYLFKIDQTQDIAQS